MEILISDRSTTKAKTFDPAWNEYFIHEVTNAKNIGLTVFHDAAIPPDDFVANCTIPFEDLAHRDKEQQDFWVSPCRCCRWLCVCKWDSACMSAMAIVITPFY